MLIHHDDVIGAARSPAQVLEWDVDKSQRCCDVAETYSQRLEVSEKGLYKNAIDTVLSYFFCKGTVVAIKSESRVVIKYWMSPTGRGWVCSMLSL